MIWLLLLLVLSGCVAQDTGAQQLVERYIAFLSNHSQDNYTLSWTYTYWKDGELADNVTVVVYNPSLVIYNFTNYSLWRYENRTCLWVEDKIGCEPATLDDIRDNYFWTPAFIEQERRFFNTLLEIAQKVEVNNNTLNVLYNYSDLSYAQLRDLRIGNPAVVNQIALINLTYNFREDGSLERVRKVLYLVNGSEYVAVVNYSPLQFYDEIPMIEPNATMNYVQVALSYILEPPSPTELRSVAVEYRMPFLCKYDTNITVCLDVYITKTKDVSACRYAPNPEECFGVYNATAGS
ncbi:MAG: hypothetical protein GXN92_02090 [Candidatus Micrarchaeota archaeon]|nr:hypothetical protein [Candidatus Micrarchaeota archaeon]